MAELDLFCCFGAVIYGPERCTCWREVLDLEQEPIQEGPVSLRAKCCHDCAYRVGSPERAAGDEDRLEHAAWAGRFFCHQGVPRTDHLDHPEGHVKPGDPGDYHPVQAADRIWRADGRPGELCAGWGTKAAAARRVLETNEQS